MRIFISLSLSRHPYYTGMQTLMPHHQIPQNVRYAMPGHPSISPGPQAQLMYHPHPAQAPSPYGTAAQWQLAAAPSPAPHPSGGGSDRATPNPMMPPEYLHHAQLPPGMILQQAAHMLQPTNNQSQPGGVAGGNAYTTNNAAAVGPSPHPQQQ